MDMLRIDGLYKHFGDKEVLRGLYLAFPENSIFGFVGKNGSGKTTTMKTVLGLLKAESGEIFVNGKRAAYGQTATNRFIGYLPDVPEFYSFMTAQEYLRYCGELTGMKSADITARSSELLELVGLSEESHRIKGYSRGMKQRLGIAQALMNRPKLLICDEPTSALDPIGRKEILDILLSAREQTTVLFSTHILSDIERICTDVAFLNDGKAEICGSLSEIKSKYRSEEYLVELENDSDSSVFIQGFPNIRLEEANRFRFYEKDHSPFDVMRFAADHRIPILKLERSEPTLESLFMEVVEK